LENLVERWAAATGSPPPQEPRAAILVFAANHGVAAQNVSLYPARVGGQVAAAAARGESAIGVLAGALKATLTVADVGLDTPTQDITAGPALTQEQFATAFAAGAERATAAIQDKDILILGEIGIANTTVASALLAGLTGLSADEVCGRGTGLDSQGLERKRASVGAALAANPQNDNDPIETLRTLGGYEFAALAGAMLAAARNRTPILLDGFAVGVAALAANRQEPALRDYLIAGHRSAEPAHQYVLTELGLEPLLDLRLRLGEASGAALALPLIGLAATVHAQMGTFADSGVDPLSAR
jgi:nicotinate-nucleotide--dimethylbenzimidazole phosphoribosyltransferase